MKRSVKMISVLMAVLMLFSVTTVLTASANTVTKDGKSYTLYSRTPTKGDLNVLIVRLGFADYPVDGEDHPADSEETLLSYFDGSSQSVNGFYETSSYGQLHLHCDKIFSYNAERNRDDYDYDAERTIDDLIYETLDRLHSKIELDDYDSDGDGYLDIVCFDFAGPKTGWGTTWWPHVRYQSNVEIGGKKINSYSFLQGSVDIFQHELGHIFGAKDYYSHNEGNTDVIMTYDKMSNNLGDHNGFTKWSYGWLTDENIVYADKASGDMTISLSPIETSDGGKKIAVIAPEIDRANGFFGEYFLVEYDSGEGASASTFEKYDRFRPGFRIFHVNAKGEFNDDEMCAVYLKTNNEIRDNLIHNVKYELDDPAMWTAKDFFYREGDSLTPATSPNSGLSDDETYNGRYTGISFTDFVTGDTPSFKVSFSDAPAPEPSVTFEPEIVDLRSDMKITLKADSVVTLREFYTREVIAQYAPYLLTEDGTKMTMSIKKTDDAREFSLCYENTSPSVQPETDYTLVIPRGLFLGSYRQPVQEYRTKVTTSDFLPLTEISGVVGYDMGYARSNLFAMRENTYGILRAPFGDPSKRFQLTEYNLSGEEVYSVSFDVPGYEFAQNSLYQCQVVRLFDGNLALILNTVKTNYFVKIDRMGHLLSELYTLDDDIFAQYGMDPRDAEFKAHLNGICAMLRRYSDNEAVLTLDFLSEPKVSEPLMAYHDYLPIDQDTYAAERYLNGSKHLTLYDIQDRAIADISFSGSYIAAFKEDGNITLVTATREGIYHADTYTKSGERIAHKDITKSAAAIVENAPYTRGYAVPNGYYLEETEMDTRYVAVFDKDWNHLDTYEFEPMVDYALVGNCGLIRRSHENEQGRVLDYVSRFNIGDFTVVPAPQKLGDANLDGTVDVTDATTVQRYDARMITLEEPALTASDVDGDGGITVIDATWIQRYDLGMKAPEGIGEPI